MSPTPSLVVAIMSVVPLTVWPVNGFVPPSGPRPPSERSLPPIPEVVASFVGRLLHEPDAQYPREPTIPTGLAVLDAALDGGLRCGQLTLIGGTTGVGCSVLALTLARQAAGVHGVRTLFVAPDTSDTELYCRLVAGEAVVHLRQLRLGAALSEMEIGRIAKCRPKLEALPLWIFGGQGWREPIMRQLDVVEYGTDPEDSWGARMVIIDGTATFEPDVRAAIFELRRLAMKRQLAVVVTSQAQVPTSRQDRPPELDDLIEYRACIDLFDTVLMVHRDDIRDPVGVRAGEADIVLAKHRYGGTRTATVMYQGHYARFVDLPETLL